MAPIRIAHVVEATTGGVARHVMDLVTHLDPARFTNILYLSFERPDSWRGPLLALQETNGIAIREIPMARLPHQATVRQLAAAMQDDRVDLLHLHSAKAGYHGRQAIRGMAQPPPVIYTPHAFAFQRTDDWRRPIYRYVERRLQAHTARLICVSEGELEEALAARLSPKRVVVIPNGVDLAAWPLIGREERRLAREMIGAHEEEIIIGAMGRLVPQKGFDLLLQAAEETLPDFRRARIVVWGDGPLRVQLRQMARALGLRRRVTFYPATDQPRMAYAAMDLFCAPSRWEAGPYAVLEAMACGLPVLASPVAGNRDAVVDLVTGVLVDTDLPGQFDAGLRKLLIDPDLRARYGVAGRQRVEERYTLEGMTVATAALYCRVLELPEVVPEPEEAPDQDAPAEEPESVTAAQPAAAAVLADGEVTVELRAEDDAPAA